MNIINSLIITSIAGLSTVIGSLIVFLKIKKQNLNKFITLCMSFSLFIMIGISIIDLIPNATFVILTKYNFIKGIAICIITLFIGITVINTIDKNINNCHNNNLYKLGILNMIVLILHNIPEGIATFMSSIYNIDLGIKLALAITLHNIPEGISIAIPIYYATKNKKEGIKKSLASGISEPLGAIFAYIFLHNYINEITINIILLLVASLMITISINKIYPEVVKYNEKKYIILGFIFSVIIISLNIMLLH